MIEKNKSNDEYAIFHHFFRKKKRLIFSLTLFFFLYYFTLPIFTAKLLTYEKIEASTLLFVWLFALSMLILTFVICFYYHWQAKKFDIVIGAIEVRKQQMSLQVEDEE